MYQIEQLNSPLDIHTENLKKKKIGKITYIKMERFLKFKTVTGYSLGIYWKVKVLVAQLCLTLCDPMDCSPAGSSVYGILQARILEWVAIPFSRRSSQLRDWTQVSCIASRFFTTEPQLGTKEGWALRNWCFQTVVLEKTLESSLDCKDIKSVDSKGNQPWIFIGSTDAGAEALILWPPGAKSQLIWKRSWCWER